MNFEEFKKYVDETLESIYLKLNEEEKTFISDLVTKFNQQCEENEELKRSYARREKKWEKFETQKNALSSAMSNYLCKYQNLKREYKIQNNRLHNYKQENQSLKEELKKLKQWDCNKDSRNSRQRVANAKLIKENQSLKDRIEKAIEYINNHTIEWVDEKFKENNIMVKFDEYSNPQALLEILKGDK